MKKPERTAFHYADIHASPRLRRLRDFLRKCGKRGATTFQIIAGARVAAVNSAVSELRRNGFRVACVCEGVDAETGSRVYRYTMTGWMKGAFLA